jgi:CBS domain-containing protein
VFGIAAGRVLGGSTQERFRLARTLLPEQESIFREASETFRVVLYQQARSGIRQNSSGSQLSPAMLSHHDRQILKSGFRSILRLLEFTAAGRWLEAA